MAVANINLHIDAFSEALQTGYNSGSRLMDRVLHLSDVQAATQRFPVLGTGEAEERASQADINPVNFGNAKPTANLAPAEAMDLIDENDLGVTNVPLAQKYGMQAGKAIGRRHDRDIIGALSAWSAAAYTRPGLVSPGNQVMVDQVGSKRGPITAENLAEGLSLLLDEDIDEGEDCTLVFQSGWFQDFAKEEKFSSMDYVNNRLTETARLAQIYGCVPIGIPNSRQAGKLPANRAYLFARNAIGLATGTVGKDNIFDWIPIKQSYLVGSKTMSGACRIQNAGIVEFVFA